MCNAKYLEEGQPSICTHENVYQLMCMLELLLNLPIVETGNRMHVQLCHNSGEISANRKTKHCLIITGEENTTRSTFSFWIVTLLGRIVAGLTRASDCKST